MNQAVVEVPAAEAPRPWRPRLVLGVAVLGLAVGAGLALRLCVRVAPLPILYQLPAFELRDEGGRPFGSAQLAGHPYVADFIYTRCHDSCPMLTAQLGALQDLLGGDVGALKLVTFTVDPLHDTPERLAVYAREAKARPGFWVFLTSAGEPPGDQIKDLLEQGFRVSVGPDESGRDPEAVNHDGHFVVVDGLGRVRAYFSPGDRGAIKAALKRLLLGD